MRLRRARRQAAQWQVPVITSANRLSRYLYGAAFGEKTGLAQLEIYEGGQWNRRSTSLWLDTKIQSDPPMIPLGAKIRVTNSAGVVGNEFVLS